MKVRRQEVDHVVPLSVRDDEAVDEEEGRAVANSCFYSANSDLPHRDVPYFAPHAAASLHHRPRLADSWTIEGHVCNGG